MVLSSITDEPALPGFLFVRFATFAHLVIALLNAIERSITLASTKTISPKYLKVPQHESINRIPSSSLLIY